MVRCIHLVIIPVTNKVHAVLMWTIPVFSGIVLVIEALAKNDRKFPF